jgi:hypothetical protein
MFATRATQSEARLAGCCSHLQGSDNSIRGVYSKQATVDDHSSRAIRWMEGPGRLSQAAKPHLRESGDAHIASGRLNCNGPAAKARRLRSGQVYYAAEV